MSNLIPILTLATLCCTVATPLRAAQAASHDVIEEIVVTAEFRDASVDGLPASVSVVRPNERGTVVNHLEEVLSRAPNVNFASGASRSRFLQIRGIGERGQFAEPLNPSVGLIVDGVDLSGVGTAATLFDVAQVEVFRGPQGTLYGANALAGLINLVTPAPTPELASTVRLDAGDYGAFGVGGFVSGPVGEQTGFRLSAQRYRDDGFTENRYLNRDDTGNHDETTVRGKLVWAGESAELTVSGGHLDIDNGYDAFSLDNDRNTRSDQPGQDQQTTDYVSTRLIYSGAQRMVFEAALGLSFSDMDYGYDEDWAFDGFDPIGYTSTDRYQRERDTGTLELRWLSKPGQGPGGGAWDWVAGVYHLRQQVELERTYTFFPGPFHSDYEIERLAAYGELSREVAPRLRLTVGARVERHTSDYDDSADVRFDPDDDLFGGRVLLEYSLDGGGLVYAGVTQGYKSGGFNQDGSLEPDRREYDPETLWNVEVGYKARWLQDRLTFRSTLFRMQRSDVQISRSATRPITGSPGAVEFIEFIDNAAQGYNQGLEVELEYEPVDGLLLFANVGLLDTEYEDDRTGRDLNGRDQAHAPNYHFFAGAEYAFGQGFSARLEAEGKDEFYFSASHDQRSDAFTLFNASVSYSAERWRLRVWARNLTDHDYEVRGYFFGNDPRDFYTARVFSQLGEPRQFGASLEVSL